MSNAHDLAWCAGFFDGEGFITIQKRNQKYKDKVYIGHYLRIGINHVAPEPLQEMQRILGGTLRKQSLETVVGNRKPRHSWQMGCGQAAEALKKLMPYFRNKNKVAELGLEFQKTMQPVIKLKVSDDILLYREMLKETITSLNAKD
jgi:hypothetical protein